MDEQTNAPASDVEPCCRVGQAELLESVLQSESELREKVGELEDRIEELQTERLTAKVLEVSMWVSLVFTLTFVSWELRRHREQLIHLGGVVKGLGAGG
jgi:hypothetical protein